MATKVTYIPEGLSSVTPYVIVRDAGAAIAFYKQVFDATELLRHTDPNGRVAHAKLRIGSSVVELGEHSDVNTLDPDLLPPVGMHLYVEDVDAVLAEALAAGAAGGPVQDQPYGDREAAVKDPFGIIWYVATHVADS